MSEDIDVEALLDAPFKRDKQLEEVDESSTNANSGKVVDSKLNAKQTKAHAVVSPENNAHVEPGRGAERNLSRHRRASPDYSRSPSSKSRHRSRRSRREYDDDNDNDEYERDLEYRRHRRSSRDAYDRHDDEYYRYEGRGYRDDNERDYERRRHGRQSSRRGSSRKRSSSPHPRSGSRSVSRGRRRGSSANRSPSPVVDESERDLRTVFAMQLSARLRRSDLVEFFSKAGRVRDAHIVSEKGSRRSRGVAYVEFYAIESAIKAVELSGQRLLGVPIIVQPSEAEKNRQSSMRQYSSTGAPLESSASSSNCLVRVSNLAVDMEGEDLRLFFGQIGQVEYCHLEDEGDGEDEEMSVFVKYSMPATAQLAVEKINGFEIFGSRLHLRMASGSERECEKRRIEAHQQPPVHEPSSTTAQEPGPVSGGPDDGTGADATSAVDAQETESVDATSMALLLSNMFDPKDEADPNWAHDLKEDVRDECSKYGDVEQVFVDKISRGDIYLKFADRRSADEALQSMSGRWFGGRQIAASLVSMERFDEAAASAAGAST